MRRPIVLVLAATVLTSGCASLRYAARETMTSEGRTRQAYFRAHRDLENGNLESAIQRFGELRERRPDAYDFALGQAEALAKAGRHADAWSALEAAVDAGLRAKWALEREEAFGPLRPDPRWSDLLERIDGNYRSHMQKIRDAKREMPLETAPTFATWANVEASFEKDRKEARKFQWAIDWTGARDIEEQLHYQRQIARVRRYLADHTDAADREQARLKEIRLRIAVAAPWQDFWAPTDAKAIEAAADRLVAEFPDGKYRSEAELHKAVAILRGVLPETGWEPGRIEPYAPDCARAIPLLEPLAATAEKDPRGEDAQGFLAYCLWEVKPRETERALATAEAFLARDQDAPEGTQYWGLTADVRKVRLLGGGLPPFEVKDLAGVTWTPASLAGRVTILQFWSPG
jgi:hypothetical protein